MRIPLISIGSRKVTGHESRARNDRAIQIRAWVALLQDRTALRESAPLNQILNSGIVASVRDFLKSPQGGSLVDRIIQIRMNTPDEILRAGKASSTEWLWGILSKDSVHTTIIPFLRTDLLDKKLADWFFEFGFESASLGILSANAQAAARYNRTALKRVGKMWARKAADDIDLIGDAAQADLMLAFDAIVNVAQNDPAVLAIIEDRWGSLMGNSPFTLDEFGEVMGHITKEFYEAGHGARDLAKALLSDPALTDKLVGAGIKNRALGIARTEVGIIQGEAAWRGIQENNFRLKQWLSAGDMKVRSRHSDNEADGAIAIDKQFSDGSMNTGFGNLSPNNCRCDCIGSVQPNSPEPTIGNPDYEQVFEV